MTRSQNPLIPHIARVRNKVTGKYWWRITNQVPKTSTGTSRPDCSWKWDYAWIWCHKQNRENYR